MSSQDWNPWKVGVIGFAVVTTTVLVTAAVVANWNGRAVPQPVPTLSRGTTRQVATTAPASVPPRAATPTPSASDIEACNRYAQSAPAHTPMDVVKDAAIGGALGAGVGAAGGAIAGGGKGAGKGAAIGGIVGATAGTLYGLNEANKGDARSVEAYRACMRERGYASAN